MRAQSSLHHLRYQGYEFKHSWRKTNKGVLMPPDSRIKHIVVLMMENRSFDHMLGFMKAENPEIRGLAPGDYSNQDNHGNPVSVADGARYQGQLVMDPGHDFTDVYQQMY